MDYRRGTKEAGAKKLQNKYVETDGCDAEEDAYMAAMDQLGVLLFLFLLVIRKKQTRLPTNTFA